MIWNPLQRRIVQDLGSKDCTVAVACMIADTDLDHAHSWAGTKRGEGWHDSIMITYLLSLGIYFPFGFEIQGGSFGVSNPVFRLVEMARETPAWIVTKRNGLDHSVFWTGEIVLDPHPNSCPIRFIEDYNIYGFSPVARFSEAQVEALKKVRKTKHFFQWK